MNDLVIGAAGHSVTLDWSLVDEILTHLSEPSYSMAGQNLSLKLMSSVIASLSERIVNLRKAIKDNIVIESFY